MRLATPRVLSTPSSIVIPKLGGLLTTRLSRDFLSVACNFFCSATSSCLVTVSPLQGINRTAYDERIKFRDPITKLDSITGYLLYIAFIKAVFTPKFQLHWVKQIWIGDKFCGKRMHMVADAILKDKEDRSDVVRELKNMGFSVLDRIKAMNLILEKPHNISIFMSLEEHDKKVYVEHLLAASASGST